MPIYTSTEWNMWTNEQNPCGEGQNHAERADVPKRFLGEAICAATYLTNRAPTSTLRVNKTPYEMWFDRKPELYFTLLISGLRVFGCTVYVQVPSQKRKKFDDRSKVMVFMGYANNGYRLWDKEQRKITISRDVLFDEHLSPFTNKRSLPAEVTTKHTHEQNYKRSAEASGFMISGLKTKITRKEQCLRTIYQMKFHKPLSDWKYVKIGRCGNVL